MKVEDIKKYLHPSPATPKGRMKRRQTGIRSTRSTPQDKGLEHTSKGEENNSYNLPKGNTECNMFCYVALSDKQTVTLYTNATGAGKVFRGKLVLLRSI